ncbi:MAG: succinate dehydrogenase, hydrophobic membrane anchor protein [Pseudomonadota bacterium]|nr:succinate dehydrogenase, hydrophobic membrane anchor protein [Pseudomonadota bacterium]
MNLRTPLARARGLGSAKTGAEHWLAERITAIALVPLSLWFALSLAGVAGADYAAAVEWVGRPLNTILLVLFLLTAFYHAIMGVQVVMEDYIHDERAKLLSIILIRFALWLLAAGAVLAVLRVAFMPVVAGEAGGHG